MRKNLAYFTEVSLTTIDNCDQSISCYQTAAGCMNPRDPKDGCSPSRLERRVDAMLSDFNGGNNHTVTVVLRGHTANILEITGQFPGTMQYAENLHVLIAQAIEHNEASSRNHKLAGLLDSTLSSEVWVLFQNVDRGKNPIDDFIRAVCRCPA